MANGLPTITSTGDPTYTWDASINYSPGDTVILGSYEVEIYAEFDSPYDYENVRSAPFTLLILDPCVSIVRQGLKEMVINVKTDPTAT